MNDDDDIDDDDDDDDEKTSHWQKVELSLGVHGLQLSSQQSPGDYMSLLSSLSSLSSPSWLVIIIMNIVL